jgi:hypothetical protein
MKTLTKAVLLSALAAPGTGEILLRRHGRGIFLLACFLIVAGSTLSAALFQIWQSLEAFSPPGAALGPEAVLNAAGQALRPHADAYVASLGVLLFLWVFSVVETYWLGRKGVWDDPLHKGPRTAGPHGPGGCRHG